MIPGIMEDILELVSVLSLPAGLGQPVGVTFWACLSGVLHHQKCLARSIHDSRHYGGHFGVGFSSFASGWPRSASGRGFLSVSGRGTLPPKMSGKVNSWYLGLYRTSRNLFRSFRFPADLGQFSSHDYVTLVGVPPPKMSGNVHSY